MGTAGAFTPTEMAELWAAERHDFIPSTFPRVSRTGNWQDVGHCTGADGNTRLVCHYAPPGNVIRQPVS